jgi:hypothetical protein
MNPMEIFLKKGSFREVRITDHAHGNRVTLYEHFRDISFGVSDNIPLAFDDALKNFESNLKRLQQDDLKRLQEEKKQMEIDLNNLTRKIEKHEGI